MIRQGNMNDLESIALIEALSYPVAEAASYESIRGRLEAFSACFWVYEDVDVLAFINGFTSDEQDLFDEMYHNPSLYNPEGEWLMIFSVATHPDHRHKGYASEVMRQVIKDTRKQGRKGIVLTCKEKLLPFYAQFGYVNEGISSSDHGGAVWYQMRLVF